MDRASSTPLFVMLAGCYGQATDDTAFLQDIWPNVERALEWIDRHGDSDGDGFVEYGRCSADGLIQQAWVEAWLDERRLKGDLPARSGRMGGPTVRKLAEEWLAVRDEEDEEDLAQATKSANGSHLEVHILSEFGDDPVAALPHEGARLSKWIKTLRKGRAKQTVRNIVATFTLLLDYAQSPEVGRILTQNPLREPWFKNLVPSKKKREGRQERIEDAVLTVEQGVVGGAHDAVDGL
jgi:hypothetical protein